MTEPQPNRQYPPTSVIAALTVVIVAAIVATSLILITIDKSQLPEGWLVVYLSFLASCITGIVGLLQNAQTRRQVDNLTNGHMDAKIRAAVADVVKDDLIDPNATEQIAADRIRRDTH